MLGQPLVQIDANGCAVLKFHWRSHLCGGEYFLNLGCNEFVGSDDVYVDIRRSVARLKLSDTPQSIGFAELEVEHELLCLDHAGKETTV